MIKRYGHELCQLDTHERNDGAWVKYEDHAAEVEMLKAEAETYRAMARKYAQNVQGLLNERRRIDASTMQDSSDINSTKRV